MGELDILSYKQKIAPNLLAVYSGEKVGKTCTIHTAVDEEAVPESAGKRLHVIDVDHGLESLIDMWLRKGKPTHEKDGRLIIGAPGQVEVVSVSNVDQFHRAVWNLPEGFDFYFIDSFTRAGKFFIQQAQPLDKETGERTPGERAKNANMDIAFLFEDYIDRLEELAWRIKRQNDGWLIINMHQKIYRKPGEQDESVEPLLYGSAGAKLDRVVTGIYRVQIARKNVGGEQVEGRVFRTGMTESVKAGDRTGALQAVEPANYAKIISKIRAYRSQVKGGETK